MADFKSIFDRAYVEHFLGAVAGSFDVDTVWAEISAMEMKARASHLGNILVEVHGRPEALAATLDGLYDRGDFTGFRAWPMTCAVESLAVDHPEIALAQLKRWTRVFTGEFAVRPLLNAHFEHSMKEFRAWRDDEDEHVRRLVSEGTRPRLPWGTNVRAIDENPEAVVDLIRPLRHDSSPYVRRSVANHLNDWTRLKPDFAKAEIQTWGDTAHENEVRSRALRTLVKAGDPEALAMLGFEGRLDVVDFECARSVVFPGDLKFSITLKNASERTVECVLDYAIAHAGKSSGRSPKVFKWKNLRVGPGEEIRLEKSHTMRPITTRRYYNGEHVWSCQVNGEQLALAAFELSGVP